MSSSDDEGETVPDTVSDYYFCHGDEEPISFSKLPLQLDGNESDNSSPNTETIFLRGTSDNGLQKEYRPVKAWKYDLSKSKPRISVLTKDNHWIKLQKPRKSYENEIRSILITVHCLSYLKSKPEASAKSLWDHLTKVFSLYDVRPSENDLRDHKSFIRDAVDRDETLAKSKFLAAFLENPRKRKISEEVETATKPSFIVDDSTIEPQDDDFVTEPNEDSDSDEEEDNFDSVCAICDNGGELTCCEGKCFRSFHATRDSEEAEESNCKSLGLTPDQVKRIQQFRCENCMYNLHQCFVCNKLGSSDKSSGAEVFRCSSASCGHFYHPKCVAKLLQPNVETEQKNLLEKIASGEPFMCPAHKCDVCNQTENEKVKDLQFAICRRCPTSYHRKCIPKTIKFDDDNDEDEDDDDDDDVVVRAWDKLLSKSRALIYCTNHEIDEDLGTPVRTIIFKNVRQRKIDQQSKLPLKKKKPVVKESEQTAKKPVIIKSHKSGEKDKPSTSKMEDSSSKKRPLVPISSKSVPLKKKKVADISNSKNSLKRSLSAKVKSNDGQPSLGSRLFDYMNRGTEMEPDNVVMDDDVSVDESKQIESVHNEILPSLDEASKQRILDLMEDAASSVTLDDVKKFHGRKAPSTHGRKASSMEGKHHSSVADKIMLSRIEGHIEGLHVALKKLEEGCSLEDAKAFCQPRDLDELWRWKDKLRGYLAPVLFGSRYTPFGRHFTKVEKLEKIVDKLKYYVEDGDTVVDFCCGANDFSSLMKNRLDEMGKNKCSYKNYDISRPKNDFHFEKRDWMTVNTKELPKGEKLIMGLNPPFGKNACLANQFIQQAVKFAPKLLILIVPPETERLDGEKQKVPYELVWEDDELLAGKSFYLPGSIDVNAKQVDQWNQTTPVLYLWSRPDRTMKHKEIAQQHGHLPTPPTPHETPTLSNDINTHPAPAPIEVVDKKIPEDKPKPNNTKKHKKQSPKKKKHTPQSNRSPKKTSQESKTNDKKQAHRDEDENKGQKVDIKDHSPGPTVDHETSHPKDVSQSPDYTSRSDRRYTTTTTTTTSTEEAAPYAYYSRRAAADHAPNPSYSMRPNEAPPLQYKPVVYEYDRGQGGSYYDDVGSSRYSTPAPAPAPRYGGHAAPYNNNSNNRSSTSTMQRYAPRLDELNHTRMDSVDEMRMTNRGYGAPPPMHVPGFAPGPYNPYPHNHNSSGGWLNE